MVVRLRAAVGRGGEPLLGVLPGSLPRTRGRDRDHLRVKIPLAAQEHLELVCFLSAAVSDRWLLLSPRNLHRSAFSFSKPRPRCRIPGIRPVQSPAPPLTPPPCCAAATPQRPSVGQTLAAELAPLAWAIRRTPQGCPCFLPLARRKPPTRLLAGVPPQTPHQGRTALDPQIGEGASTPAKPPQTRSRRAWPLEPSLGCEPARANAVSRCQLAAADGLRPGLRPTLRSLNLDTALAPRSPGQCQGWIALPLASLRASASTLAFPTWAATSNPACLLAPLLGALRLLATKEACDESRRRRRGLEGRQKNQRPSPTS